MRRKATQYGAGQTGCEHATATDCHEGLRLGHWTRYPCVGWGSTADDGYGLTVFRVEKVSEVLPANGPFRIPFAKVGNRIRVTGFGGQYQSQYEVMPRFRSDIVALP